MARSNKNRPSNHELLGGSALPVFAALASIPSVRFYSCKPALLFFGNWPITLDRPASSPVCLAPNRTKERIVKAWIMLMLALSLPMAAVAEDFLNIIAGIDGDGEFGDESEAEVVKADEWKPKIV